MNYKKIGSLFVAMILLALALAACGTTSNTPKFPTGKFQLSSDDEIYYVFNPDKTWEYHTYGDIGAQGKYSVKGDVWVNKGDADCPFDGNYQWTFDGTNLAFKLVGEDACTARKEATKAKTFVLSQ